MRERPAFKDGGKCELLFVLLKKYEIQMFDVQRTLLHAVLNL